MKKIHITDDLFNVLNLCESLNNYDIKLYHNTSIEHLMSMMSSDRLSSDYHRGYGESTHNGICFTRSKTYNPYSEYHIKLCFNVSDLLGISRGLKLVPYRDPMYYSIDEYEERLISRSGKPFVLNNLHSIVSDVYIMLDTICGYIIENCEDVDGYIDDLEWIYNHNKFGDKLKFIKSINDSQLLSFDEACDYIRCECGYDDDVKFVYCVEALDDEHNCYVEVEYFSYKNEAVNYAEKLYHDDGKVSRVTCGEYDGNNYEMKSVICVYGL